MKLFYFVLQLTIFCQVALSEKVQQCRLQKDDQTCLIVIVTKVLNGTTVEFKEAINGNATKQIVHLHGISSPSLNSIYQNYSKIHLSRLLGRKNLKLIIKKSKNIYGGLVGTFYKKSRDVNKKMISDGYAWCYQNDNCPKEYFKATRKAITRRKGIWKTFNIKDLKKTNKNGKGSMKTFNRRKLKKNNKYEKEKCSNIPKEEFQVSVVKVIDGDTIYVQKINSPNSSTLKVRMSGIDAPELKQFYGMESKQHLQQLVDSFKTKTFQLSLGCTDIYGRQLATLKSGVVDINKSVVENGYTWCYRYTQCPLSYRTAMANAKSMKKGLFAHGNPMTPWDWRQTNKVKNSVFPRD